MNKTEILFLDLLKQSIFSKDEYPKLILSSEDVKNMINMSVQHICQGYIFKAFFMNNAEIPTEFNIYIKQLIYRNYNYLSVQEEILEKLRENNIKCVILKGCSVSMNYNDPMYRILGDIDILVDESDYEKAIHIFLGDKPHDPQKDKHKFHYGLEYKGYTIEVHKYITIYSSENENLKNELNNILDDTQIGILDIYKFPILNNKHQAICLLMHLKRHMLRNNTNLRMLIDYLVFANKIPDNEWINNIYPALKKLDLDILADLLFEISDKYFGTNNTLKTKKITDQHYVDELMDEIIESGVTDSSEKLANTFGTPENNSEKNNKIKVIFNTLNNLSVKNFKIAKYKITLPICWCMIVLRYFFRVLFKKRAKITLKQISQSIDRKNELYEILKFNK